MAFSLKHRTAASSQAERFLALFSRIALWEVTIIRSEEMKKQETRRAVIREWMGLSRDKRQTEEQTTSFVKKAIQRHELPRSRRAPHRVILGWLLPRTGKP